MEATSYDNNTKIISQVGQYVYDNSEQAISLDELANYTGFSKYHFNRIFHAATGYQLGEFIKRHKLEKALYLIKQGNHNIIDVALSVGYDSPSSFTRAFKKNFCVTPTDVLQGILPNNQRAGSLAPKKPFSEHPIKPVLNSMPEQQIYGLYDKGFSQQSFSEVAQRLYSRLTDMALPLSFEALMPIGVSVDNPWVGEQTESRFFAGFLNGLDSHQHDLDIFCWGAGQWACFTHHGPHDTMWQTISKVYALWVLPEAIKLKDQQIVQRYLNNPKDTAPQDLQTELYFAVEDTSISN